MFYNDDFTILSPEQRQVVLSKPFWRMRWFASLLGWRGLRIEWIRLQGEYADPLRPGRIVIYYLTTDKYFKIQINEESPDQPRRHLATVGGERYGLGAIGWHSFELFESDIELAAEAERLRPFLDRQLLRNPTRRAKFKKAHPELFPRRY